MTTKRRIVASNESFSSDDEGTENNLIEELNEDEQEFISTRKRLRSNIQAEEKSKDALESDDEIFYDEEDVDISSILSGKFKPDPFGRRTSEDLSDEHETIEPRKLPKRRARRTKKFESHLQDYENNALPEKLESKNSRLTQGSEERSDEDDIAIEPLNVENDDDEQMDEYEEYISSESDASFAPKDVEKDDSVDQEMNGDSEMQEAEIPEESEPGDFDDLTPVQKPRARKYATRSSARSRKDDASEEQEAGLDDISVSDEEALPKKRAASKRKREILSDEEQEDSEEPTNSSHRVKKPRIVDESLSQHESKSASSEDGKDGDKGADDGGFSDAESIDLQSEAEEDNIDSDDDDFENKVPGDWRDFMDLLRKIEAMVEELRSKGRPKKRRGGNKQYSGALEQLLYFTDHTNDMGQMFVSTVSHTTFLERIARTWSVFLKEVGLRLEQSQLDSILRTFVRCHRKPYLKIASMMWKYVFTKKERVYALTHDELLDICSPKAKLTVEKQVQYLWLAKRLRNDNQDFESLMLCCSMGEFYKHRYPKKRTVQITEWEGELHQRFVTHMLTLAASPLRDINDMSLFNVAGWKYVSIVAGNPMAYMDLQLSEGVKRDFVTRFVLYYTIMYTRTNYFNSIKEKCEKLRRTIRTNINFEVAFVCLRNPEFDDFVRLAENGCVWLQNIVLERLLLFGADLVATPLSLFKILVYKGLWDIAISSVLSAPVQVRGLCKMMVTEIQSLIPLPATARHMYIEVIEKRIRFKEKLTGATRVGIEAIGQVSMSMKIYLTAIGNAYEMIGHLKAILPSPSDLRLLRYHLVSLDKERGWTLIMNHVEDRCRKPEQRHEYMALRKETPYINTDANWIEKILARSDVDALNIED